MSSATIVSYRMSNGAHSVSDQHQQPPSGSQRPARANSPAVGTSTSDQLLSSPLGPQHHHHHSPSDGASSPIGHRQTSRSPASGGSHRRPAASSGGLMLNSSPTGTTSSFQGMDGTSGYAATSGSANRPHSASASGSGQQQQQRPALLQPKMLWFGGEAPSSADASPTEPLENGSSPSCSGLGGNSAASSTYARRYQAQLDASNGSNQTPPPTPHRQSMPQTPLSARGHRTEVLGRLNPSDAPPQSPFVQMDPSSLHRQNSNLFVGGNSSFPSSLSGSFASSPSGSFPQSPVVSSAARRASSPGASRRFADPNASSTSSVPDSSPSTPRPNITLISNPMAMPSVSGGGTPTLSQQQRGGSRASLLTGPRETGDGGFYSSSSALAARRQQTQQAFVQPPPPPAFLDESITTTSNAHSTITQPHTVQQQQQRASSKQQQQQSSPPPASSSFAFHEFEKMRFFQDESISSKRQQDKDSNKTDDSQPSLQTPRGGTTPRSSHHQQQQQQHRVIHQQSASSVPPPPALSNGGGSSSPRLGTPSRAHQTTHGPTSTLLREANQLLQQTTSSGSHTPRRYNSPAISSRRGTTNLNLQQGTAIVNPLPSSTSSFGTSSSPAMGGGGSRARTPTRLLSTANNGGHHHHHASSSSQAHQTTRSLLKSIAAAWNSKAAENASCYKEGGYLAVNPGDVLSGRYEIIRKLGWGEFSTVWLCLDKRAKHPSGALVAVKIAKCRADITRGAGLECLLLTFLRDTMKAGHTPITTIYNTFEQQGPFGSHFCMTMPVQGPNLLCVIDHFKQKRRRRTDKELALVKDITIGVLRALEHLESINVLHTDLKPENVLCAMPDQRHVVAVSDYLEKRCAPGSTPHDKESMIKAFANGGTSSSSSSGAGSIVSLADFGLSLLLEPQSAATPPQQSASSEGGPAKIVLNTQTVKSAIINRKSLPVYTPGTLSNAKQGMLIQTREYRAPEVLFGTDFNCRSDIWSLGCMVYELLSGEFLMDPKRKTKVERDMDVEHLIMMMELIGPVPGHISRNPEYGKYHSRYFDQQGRFVRSGSIQRRNVSAELAGYVESGSEAERAAQFILSCFTYDCQERCNATDLLRHSWLRSGSE